LQPLDLSIFGPVKTIYRSEISRISCLTDSTPIGKATFLGAYHKARTGALTIRNITAGWKASGLWPVNRSKPLLSRLLAQPLEPIATPAAATVVAETLLQIEPRDLLATPHHSSQVSKLARTFITASTDQKTARLLFRKIGRSLDGQSTKLAAAEATIQKLELQIDHLRPRKRAKVKESPNSRFVQIDQIVKAQKRLAQQLEPARLSQLTSSIEFEAQCHEWQLD
jgi:4-hydroxybenzoate polyprenyltransferase